MRSGGGSPEGAAWATLWPEGGAEGRGQVGRLVTSHLSQGPATLGFWAAGSCGGGVCARATVPLRAQSCAL